MLLASPKLALEADSPIPAADARAENTGPVPLSAEGLSVLISDIFFVLTFIGVSDTVFRAGSLGRRYDPFAPPGGES